MTKGMTILIDGHASTWSCSAIWLELPDSSCQKSTVEPPLSGSFLSHAGKRNWAWVGSERLDVNILIGLCRFPLVKLHNNVTIFRSDFPNLVQVIDLRLCWQQLLCIPQWHVVCSNVYCLKTKLWKVQLLSLCTVCHDRSHFCAFFRPFILHLLNFYTWQLHMQVFHYCNTWRVNSTTGVLHMYLSCHPLLK